MSHTLRFPTGAAPLIALRKAGEVPALPVLVSLLCKLDFSNFTLSASPGCSYDWRPVAGLDVEVFADTGASFVELLRTLAGIAAVVPKSLVLTFREGPRVHCGESRVVPGEDFALFDWFPMPVCPMGEPDANGERIPMRDWEAAWRGARAVAKRIYGELGRSIPADYDRACDLVVQAARENSLSGRLAGLDATEACADSLGRREGAFSQAVGVPGNVGEAA